MLTTSFERQLLLFFPSAGTYLPFDRPPRPPPHQGTPRVRQQGVRHPDRHPQGADRRERAGYRGAPKADGGSQDERKGCRR
jgi:hypothetical protein